MPTRQLGKWGDAIALCTKSPANLADAAVQLRRLEAIVDAGATLSIDWRGLGRLVGSVRAAVEGAVGGTQLLEINLPTLATPARFAAIIPQRAYERILGYARG